ncbi:MAG: hypothetical protein Kow0037_19590 [Calditrichia bacterium]
MAARFVFGVKQQNGQWQLLRNGVPVTHFSNMEEALREAEEMARQHFSSQVVVYRENGSVLNKFLVH